jgi:hypothetical protein
MSDREQKRTTVGTRLWDRVRRLLGKKSPPPGDPYAYRMAPVRRGPKGRSARRLQNPKKIRTELILHAGLKLLFILPHV